MLRVLGFLLLALPLTATDRYVSPMGNDANPGTLLSPYRTIAKGKAALMPGDTLFVRGGTYPLNIEPPVVMGKTSIVPYRGERVYFQPLSGPPILFDDPITAWSEPALSFEQRLTVRAVPAEPVPDVRVELKPGGRLSTVRWTYRKTDTSTTVFCTVNKSTQVEVQ